MGTFFPIFYYKLSLPALSELEAVSNPYYLFLLEETLNL